MDGGAFSAINTTFKFVEFCYKLRDVSEENLVFVRLIQRVRDDLEEAFRIMRLPAIQSYFNHEPGEKSYIEGTINSARVALASIGKFVEGVRIDEERNGSIGLYNRFEWILRHQSKLLTRQMELDTCHKSLLQGIQSMKLAQHLTPTLPTYDQATDPSPKVDDELEHFLSARGRRHRKGSHKSENNQVDSPPIPEAIGAPQTLVGDNYFKHAPPLFRDEPVPYSQPGANPSIVESASIPLELEATPRTSKTQASTFSSLNQSPIEIETSYFPSASPTPFFPAELSSHNSTRHHYAPSQAPTPGSYLSTQTYPPPSLYQSGSRAHQRWDAAANAPEVLPSEFHPSRTISYESCLPEVASSRSYGDNASDRHLSLPEITHPQAREQAEKEIAMAGDMPGLLHRSASRDLRERRRARLNLIAGD